MLCTILNGWRERESWRSAGPTHVIHVFRSGEMFWKKIKLKWMKMSSRKCEWIALHCTGGERQITIIFIKLFKCLMLQEINQWPDEMMQVPPQTDHFPVTAATFWFTDKSVRSFALRLRWTSDASSTRTRGFIKSLYFYKYKNILCENTLSPCVNKGDKALCSGSVYFFTQIHWSSAPTGRKLTSVCAHEHQA